MVTTRLMAAGVEQVTQVGLFQEVEGEIAWRWQQGTESITKPLSSNPSGTIF